MHLNIASEAALIGDPTRAALLVALFDGRAQPASALAYAAAVSPQVASNHLAKLERGGLLVVEQEGRHRYYRLASAEVAAALESLAALASSRMAVRKPRTRADGELCFARTCYRHLAGTVGVAITDALVAKGYLLEAEPKVFALGDDGRAWFDEIGVDLTGDGRRVLARRCLDWTERRHHLAGIAGDRLFARLRARRWLEQRAGARTVRVTAAGVRGLADMLDLDLSRLAARRS